MEAEKAIITREDDEEGKYQIWFKDCNGDTYGDCVIVNSLEIDV